MLADFGSSPSEPEPRANHLRPHVGLGRSYDGVCWCPCWDVERQTAFLLWSSVRDISSPKPYGVGSFPSILLTFLSRSRLCRILCFFHQSLQYVLWESSPYTLMVTCGSRHVGVHSSVSCRWHFYPLWIRCSSNLQTWCFCLHFGTMILQSLDTVSKFPCQGIVFVSPYYRDKMHLKMSYQWLP